VQWLRLLWWRSVITVWVVMCVASESYYSPNVIFGSTACGMHGAKRKFGNKPEGKSTWMKYMRGYIAVAVKEM